MNKEVGRVTHFFNHIRVAVLQLNSELNVGDTIHILGHTTDFTQPVGSMEIDHKKIDTAGPGDDIALQVAERVRAGDIVYLVTGD